MKKILIAFYSRTGTTRKIANLLKQDLDCGTEEIIDLKSRKGFGATWAEGLTSKSAAKGL